MKIPIEETIGKKAAASAIKLMRRAREKTVSLLTFTPEASHELDDLYTLCEERRVTGDVKETDELDAMIKRKNVAMTLKTLGLPAATIVAGVYFDLAAQNLGISGTGTFAAVSAMAADAIVLSLANAKTAIAPNEDGFLYRERSLNGIGSRLSKASTRIKGFISSAAEKVSDKIQQIR